MMIMVDFINSVFLGCRKQSGHDGSSLNVCKSALRWFKGILFAMVLIGLPFVMTANAGPIVNSATGTANGLAMDLTNAVVSLNQPVGFAVTSAAAEIDLNAVAVGSAGNAFVYDIQPTINAGDTGVNVTAITVPAGYSNFNVTGVSVGGAGQALNCPAPGAAEYCAAIAGQVMTITLGTKVTVSGTNIQVNFTADAPAVSGIADFTSTVDDSITPAFAAQATAAGNADGDAADNNSISVQVEGNAVTSVAVEISPNSVVMNSVGNAFVYDILPTINAVDTGVNVMAITAPAGYSTLTVTGVSVGGAVQVLNCALGAGEYCVNIVGQVMTITLGTKVTVSGTNIQVSFTADAPAASGIAGFTSTVDDNTTGLFAAQAATAGNADGDAGDNNALTVTVTGFAVTSVAAEISPNSISISSVGNVFIYDILPTINAGDTGVNEAVITAPVGYSNINVTGVSVGGAVQVLNCPAPGAAEYCAAIAGQVMTITLGTKVTVGGTNIQISLTADAPGAVSSADFVSTVDDSSTPAFAVQATAAGNADGDALDANSITVNVAGIVPDLSRSTVMADPIIVIADGVSTSTVTTTLRTSADQPVPGKAITLSSDRGAPDIFVQPPATNASGVADGTVSSSVAGVSTITSTDTTDGLVLPMKPVVYFTQGRVLELIKTANKKEAVVGDVVTYLVEIKNTTAKDVIEVRVADRIPPNFKYIKGSAILNGGQLNDPSGNRALTFNVGVVPAMIDSNGNSNADPGEQGYMTLSYQLVIGSGATPGEYENTAVARDVCDMCLISNDDNAKVTVTLDPVFDLGTIIGKVFEDKDRDGQQDIGEDGIAGAMVALDNGTYALTDIHGRYHFPAVYPGHRLVKINLGNFPDGAATTTDEALVVSVTPGLLAKANFGVVYSDDDEGIGSEQVHIVGNVKNMTLVINGKLSSIRTGSIQMMVEDVYDVVEMKDDRLVKPVEFLIRIDGPEEVARWKVIVLNSDEAVLKTIEGIGPPPGAVQWDGFDEQGRIIQGGDIFQYQLEMLYKDRTRSMSARKLFGVNRTSVISLNLTGGAFATGSDRLSTNARYLLKGVAESLREYPDEKIVMEGHADSVGDEEINTGLSKRRAEAAVTYLVDSEGISRDRFTVRWYGESRPVAGNLKPDERELNRRIELKGEISKFDEAEPHDQYRTKPVVRINGSDVSIDSHGIFSTTVQDAETIDLEVEVKSEQGQEVYTRMRIPTSVRIPTSMGMTRNMRIPSIEIIKPKSGKTMVYESEGDSCHVSISQESETVNPDDILMSCKLEGVTEPGNTVELDGKPLAVGAVGIFNDEIRLRMGDNTFKLVARNSEGGLRVNHLNVVVSYKKEDGKYFIAVKPGPYMTVNLPPKGTLLRSLSLAVSGATGPENRINVNGKPATVQPDGGFLATVELPEGRSLVVIEVTDPEGYMGVIEHEVKASETRLFFLAFADAKMGILQGRGYLEGAGMDDPEEYFTEGRAVFYLKGHVLGKYLITAAFDTGANEFDKMFKDLDESENDRLLTNLDPDKLYPVYGDSSTIVYDTESQGKLYLAVESDEFNLLVGNYQLNLNDTELATFQRTLYGERIEYQSASRTKYGEPDTKIMVFGAEVRQAHIRDELSATGGSLYYLSHKDVIEGSEQVTIIIRDKDTGLMVSKLQQQQNVDYQIKYEEGRIMFNRPISSVMEDDRLIDRALLSGSPVFVQVDYETAVESFEKTGYGGRARKQIGDHVAVGGTYVKDELAAGKYNLTSFDSEVRLGMNTRFLVEYAESSGTDAIIYRSDNGGLTYSEETPAGIMEGSAWKTSAELDIGEWFGSPDRIQAGGYYKKLDSGFLSSGNFIERGTEKFGVNLKLQITEPDKLLARYDREEFESGVSIGNNQNGSGTIQLVHDKDWWNLAGEYSMRKSEGEVNDSTSLGALRLRMKLNEKLSVSAEHQQTITGTENNQTTLGSEYQILPSLALSVAGTTGTLGRSAQGGAVFSLGDKRVYLTERISEDNGGRTTSTVLGTEAPVGNASKVYSEYQWERSDLDNRQLSLVGAEKKWDMTKGLKLLVAGEHTDIDSDSGGSSRYTLSTGLSYVLNGFNASTRNEVRKEEGDNERVQYLTTNSVELKLSPDYTLLGKYKYSKTRDMDNDSTEAELNESGVGLAYRPVEFDRLNALARYTHLSDQRPLSLGEMEPLVTTMDVSSIEWSLDVTSYLEWVEKFALKVKTEETGDRPAVTTHTYLVINRFNFNVWRSFDLGAEYRVLVQKEADDKRQGWLTELMWNATEHIRLGLGYNFTDFSDNEFSDNNYSVRGCFIRLQAKY